MLSKTICPIVGLIAQIEPHWSDERVALYAKDQLLPALDDIMLASLLKPDDHLRGYMNRYWLVSPAEARGMGLAYHGIRLHHILREDYDRHGHNHPWGFRSVILSGWYEEELLLADGSQIIQRVTAGDTYRRARDQYHRITEIGREGPLLTLCFLEGLQPDGWGFMTAHGHVDSHVYLSY